MRKTKRLTKRPYKPPRLSCYGDLRTLTLGGAQNKNEANVAGPKTRGSGTA